MIRDLDKFEIYLQTCIDKAVVKGYTILPELVLLDNTCDVIGAAMLEEGFTEYTYSNYEALRKILVGKFGINTQDLSYVYWGFDGMSERKAAREKADLEVIAIGKRLASSNVKINTSFIKEIPDDE